MNARKIELIILIIGRFVIAFALAMIPFMFGLKKGWYIIPLIVLNFVAQFVLAFVQIRPWWKELLKRYKDEKLHESVSRTHTWK